MQMDGDALRLLCVKLKLQCLLQDSVIVGSVRSNDWRGALYEVTGSGSEFRQTEIIDPAVNKDSYMGMLESLFVPCVM